MRISVWGPYRFGYLDSMHSSRMRTARLLTVFRGGGLLTEGVSASWGMVYGYRGGEGVYMSLGQENGGMTDNQV